MNKLFYATIKEFTLMLVKNEIPFSYSLLYDGAQWSFPKFKGDISIHSGTYASDRGYLESYNMPWDEDDVSVCTPEEMIELLNGNKSNKEYEYHYTPDDTFNSLSTLLNLGE